MNGIVLDQIKKNNEILKNQKIKTRSILILSNILTFALTLLIFAKESDLQKKQSPTNRTFHRNHQVVVVPLKMMAETSSDLSEIPLTLINSKNQILVKRVYFIGKIKTEKNFEEKNDLFKIEIPEDEILKLKADDQEDMIAVPEIKRNTFQNISHNRSKSKYEVNL